MPLMPIKMMSAMKPNMMPKKGSMATDKGHPAKMGMMSKGKMMMGKMMSKMGKRGGY